MTAEYFLPFMQPLVPVTDTIRTFATVLAAASYGVGNAMLFLIHARRVYRRMTAPHWGYSVIFLIVFLVMLISGIPKGTEGDLFRWFYDHLLAPGGQALYSTTAFYITTAGYRVFRFRNLDAAVLMICGLFILWSVLPLFTGAFPVLSDIGGWINDVVAVAAYRGFVMGVALGIIGLSLRVFLHKHREVLG